MLHDACQLNRVELMLSTVLQAVTANPQSANIDEHDVVVESVPCVTDQQLMPSSNGSSRKRKQRAAKTRKRLWELCHPTESDEVITRNRGLPETLGAESDAVVRAMFQKLVDVEAKVDSVSASADEANVKACQSMAMAETLRIDCDSVGDQVADKDCLQNLVPASTVSDQQPPSAPKAQKIVDADEQKFLMGLRGQRKEDAVLNLLLNKACPCSDVEKVLDDMEKYFQSDLPKLASFLGVKFGFKVGDWRDCRSQVMSAAADTFQEGSSAMASVGILLKEMRRSRANIRSDSHERTKQLTDELTRPRKNKRRK